MTSASASARSAAARMATWSWYSGSSKPGEAVKMYCVSSRLSRPTTGSRVDCGFGDTIARCSPTRAFRSEDFPTLGRPARTTVPQRVMSAGEDDGAAAGHAGKGTASGKDVKEESSRKNVTENRDTATILRDVFP